MLDMPTHSSRMFDKDRKAAGILKTTPEGKTDFHALRVTYVTHLLESGASAKEAQELARHATPDITMNTYARTRRENLQKVTESVGKTMEGGRKRAHSVHKEAAGTEGQTLNSGGDTTYGDNEGGGGCGTRI